MTSALASDGAQEGPRLYQEAHADVQNLDYEAALLRLEKAVALPGLSGPLRALLLVDLGVTHGGLGNEAGAEQDFEKALLADPAVSAPLGVSPKIAELFSAAQAKRAPAPLGRPADEAVQDRPPVVAQQGAGVSWTLPALCGGIAAAGLGVGIGAAVSSNDLANQLRSGLNSQATVSSRLSSQENLRTVAVVAYSAAGAAAVVGAVYLVLELTGKKDHVAAALGSSSGALALEF
jgi:tetratricopeptide (TPR) repeat protein